MKFCSKKAKIVIKRSNNPIIPIIQENIFTVYSSPNITIDVFDKAGFMFSEVYSDPYALKLKLPSMDLCKLRNLLEEKRFRAQL